MSVWKLRPGGERKNSSRIAPTNINSSCLASLCETAEALDSECRKTWVTFVKKHIHHAENRTVKVGVKEIKGEN